MRASTSLSLLAVPLAAAFVLAAPAFAQAPATPVPAAAPAPALPAGVAGDAKDNIIHDVTVDPATGHTTSKGGFGHPTCSADSTKIANELPKTHPTGAK